MIIVLDTETTGFEPDKHCVVELAGVSIEPRQRRLHQAWSALIQPRTPIPPEASAIHHLTAESFDTCYETLDEAWKNMSRILLQGDPPLAFVAHNAEFDKGFLKEQVGETPMLCTWRSALHLFPDAPGYGNQTLSYYLDLKVPIPEGLGAHRALFDTIVTAELARHMLNLRTLEDLLILQDQPVLLKTCNFGKHRGELWRDVPKGYLKWILRNGDFDVDTLHTARHYLG